MEHDVLDDEVEHDVLDDDVEHDVLDDDDVEHDVRLGVK